MVTAANHDLEQIVATHFPADKFVRVRDIPIFAEHEAEGPDGQRIVYDRPALQAIVDRCNRRIQDTGDFAVLTDGHTPEKEEQIAGMKQPEVVGFVGPFKLGKIGSLNPRYAILADEFRFKDRADRVSRLPRRSVELWMSDNPNERFFDPIAALGAECPRLDLGIKYAMLPNGQRVLKYSAEAPERLGTTQQYGLGSAIGKALGIKKRYEMEGGGGDAAPGGSNTYVAGETAGRKKSQYGIEQEPIPGSPLKPMPKGYDWEHPASKPNFKSAESESASKPPTKYGTETQTGEPGMFQPEDLKQLLDAMNSLDWVQWVKGKMTAEMAPGGEGPAAPAPSPAPAGGPPPGAAPPPGMAPPAAGPAELGGQEEELGAEEEGLGAEEEHLGEEEARPEEAKKMPFGCDGMKKPQNHTIKMSRAEFSSQQERYRKLDSAHKALAQKYERLSADVAVMQRESSDAVRQARIEQAASGSAIDVEDELNRCLYSKGSALTDEQFEDRLATVVKYARPIPLGESLPRGVVSTPNSEDRARTGLSDRAVEIAEKYRREGKQITYRAALEEARAEKNGHATVK